MRELPHSMQTGIPPILVGVIRFGLEEDLLEQS